MQPPNSGDRPPLPNYNEPIPSIPSGAPDAPPNTPAQFSGRPAGPPQIRFEAIGEAWTLFQQQMITWILAVLLYFVIVGILGGVVTLPFMLPLMRMNEAAADNNPLLVLGPMMGMYGLLFLVVIPVSYVLMGGLYRMAIKQLRGQPISVGDVFNITDVLPALIGSMFLVTLAASLAVIVGFILCGLPGLVVYALFMLTMPLIVDRRIGSIEAMKLSWNALKPHWLMATLYLFVISIVGQIGAVLCYVGIIVTYPLFILCIAILYRDFFGDVPEAQLQAPSEYSTF